MSQVEESVATYAEVSSPPMAKERFTMEENECYSGLKVASLKNTAASSGNKSIIIALVVKIVLVAIATDSCCICLLCSFCS